MSEPVPHMITLTVCGPHAQLSPLDMLAVLHGMQGHPPMVHGHAGPTHLTAALRHAGPAAHVDVAAQCTTVHMEVLEEWRPWEALQSDSVRVIMRSHAGLIIRH